MNSLTRLLLLLMLIIAAGCRDKQSPREGTEQTSAAPVKLTLLVLDDRELSAAIRRQWAERGEGELIVQDQTAAEFQTASSKELMADAIIYPAGMIGDLAQSELIGPIPAATMRDPNLAWTDVFDLIRLREVMWDRKVYALPLGSPQFALFYRTDVFSKLSLRPPETWEEYTSVVNHLSEAAAGEDAGFELASAEPLAPGWAGHTLIARAAAYARHRNFLSALFDVETMQPLIDQPPFVRALEELIASKPSADSLGWEPHDTLQQLQSGKVAMALAWPASASAANERGAAEHLQLSVVELPGATQSYDRDRRVWDPRSDNESKVTLLPSAGRFASISRRTPHPQPAANLLVWISGREWSAELAPASRHVTLYRRAHMHDPRRWASAASVNEQLAVEYAQVLSQSLSRSESILSVRLAGRDEYLAALDEAVASVVRGEQTPEDALIKAAETWNAITDRIGREEQRAAYRRSLSL